MSIFEAIVLGSVQGLTEFVPVSSSGHLVLVPAALDWGPPGLAFDVMLHFASLLALLLYFSGELLDLWRGVIAGDREQRRMAFLLVVATVPTVIAAGAFGGFFERSFEDASASALQLLLTAVILVAAEQALRYHERKTARRGRRLKHLGDFRPPDAGVVGVAQAISILPGISRSGATIGAGLGLGFEREDSAHFAFLLSVPALFGAALVQLPELGGSTLGIGAALAGFVASLVTSYASIAVLIRYLKSNTLYPFAIYCVIAGLVFYAIV